MPSPWNDMSVDMVAANTIHHSSYASWGGAESMLNLMALEC